MNIPDAANYATWPISKIPDTNTWINLVPDRGNRILKQFMDTLGVDIYGISIATFPHQVFRYD